MLLIKQFVERIVYFTSILSTITYILLPHFEQSYFVQRLLEREPINTGKQNENLLCKSPKLS